MNKEKRETGVLLAGYFRRHRVDFCAILLFALIFAVVFSLYQLPVEAVLYGAVLCLAAGILIFGIDYLNYWKRHRFLKELRCRITLGLSDLPDAQELLEADYQELLRIDHEDKSRLISEADKTKSDMLEYYTMWAHQIKTPIAAMRLLLSEEEETVFRELSGELFSIEQYVEMVLSYLRLSSESSDLVIKRQPLDGIVRQAVRKFAGQFVRKKVALQYAGVETEVLTDEKWLLFVIEQILSNALKYTPKGTISIYLEPDQTLVIEDTGIGIAAEDLPRIFEKGFTGYNGRINKKSTGIGLYLCQRILKKLSHTIAIESEPGRGTKVKIGLASALLEVE
ncbi:sensor histidine kinase [Hominifimenecus sp. rT4P-3]|uniref:sensor histidine kinase n=1 Tax=Hominifimenecus sp. rT4P-3 TaxID=3242979 RepID=UPI003DA356C2